MARDDEASRAIWLDPEVGALAGLPNSSVAIESSTVSVAWINQLAERCRQDQIAFLEAPVAGSRPQAEAAQLIYVVGGEAEVMARAEPLLKTLGGTLHHAGAVGNGAAIKLAVNTLFSVQLATLAELIGLLKECDLDVSQAIQILSSTPVCSPAAKTAAGAMLARTFAPLFPIELVEKDLSYLIDAAENKGRTVPIAEVTRTVFATAIAQGYGDDTITAVACLYP